MGDFEGFLYSLVPPQVMEDGLRNGLSLLSFRVLRVLSRLAPWTEPERPSGPPALSGQPHPPPQPPAFAARTLTLSCLQPQHFWPLLPHPHCQSRQEKGDALGLKLLQAGGEVISL